MGLEIKNVYFEECLPPSQDNIIDCPIMNIECNQNQHGAIVSPYYPLTIMDDSLFGKVYQTSKYT